MLLPHFHKHFITLICHFRNQYSVSFPCVILPFDFAALLKIHSHFVLRRVNVALESFF